MQVTATIADTFLDTSRVTASWDGTPAVSTFAWARKGKTQTVTILAKAPKAGRHELAVGRRKLGIAVRPE